MIEINPHKDKKLAVLIDPDKADDNFLNDIVKISQKFPPDCFLVGGSLLVNDRFEFVIQFLKEKTSIPVYIFPGNMMQTSPKSDGILLPIFNLWSQCRVFNRSACFGCSQTKARQY